MCSPMLLKKIKIPTSVVVDCQLDGLHISSKYGHRQLSLTTPIQFENDRDYVYLTLDKSQVPFKKYFFLYVSLIQKALRGLAQPFKISLVLKGIGFKVKKIDNQLIFKLGYSHDIVMAIPDNIQVTLIDVTKLIIYGSNFEQVTQFVSQLRHLKKVDPYKGKGILFKNEKILRKEGKKSKK